MAVTNGLGAYRHALVLPLVCLGAAAVVVTVLKMSRQAAPFVQAERWSQFSYTAGNQRIQTSIGESLSAPTSRNKDEQTPREDSGLYIGPPRSGDTAFAEAALAAALAGAPTHLWAPLARAVELCGDEAAVFDLTSGKSMSYAEIERRALRIGRWLAGGDSPVAIIMPNSALVLEAHYAISRIGGTVLNCNTRLTADELGYVLTDAGCSAIVYEESLASRVAASLEGSSLELQAALWVASKQSAPPLTVHAAKQDSYERVAQCVCDGLPHDASEMARQMYYTSGTTGRPKAVLLQARNVILHALACCVEHRLRRDDIWLHAAPMFHLVDAYAIFAVTWLGGSHVTLATYSTEALLDASERRQVTVTNLASTMISLLVARPDALLPDSMSLLSCGGAPLPRAAANKLLSSAYKGREFFQSYGMTECCGKIAQSLVDLPTRQSVDHKRLMDLVCSSGKPFSLIQLRLVDPSSMKDVTQEQQVGEVWISGPTVFDGYCGGSGDHNQHFGEPGWFRTGDLASIDNLGYLTITDRLKDMILVGSENVYCVEVERVLHDHPAVELACVYGVPDTALGERVKAVVQIVESADVSVNTLKQFAAHRLADYKVPALIEFTQRLPTTGSGKVDKGQLKRRDADAVHQTTLLNRDDVYIVAWEPAADDNPSGSPPTEVAVVAPVQSWCEETARSVARDVSSKTPASILWLSGESLSEVELEFDLAALEDITAKRIIFFADSASPGLALRHSLAVARKVAPRAEQVVVVTCGFVDSSSPTAAAVWGFWRSAATEVPGCTVRLLDVEVTTTARRLVEAALADDLTDNSERAFIHGRLVEPRLTPALGLSRASGSFRSTTHLITGASGGLGTQLALRLARAGATKLILVSRQTPTRPIGVDCDCDFVAADISVEADVESLFVHGTLPDAVWHLAGVVDDGPASTVSVDRFAKVVAPKIDGSLHLAKHAPSTARLVFFSSVYGLLGSPQLTHYSAANAFQDGLAASLGARRALAVSWGVWADAGMAHRFGDGFRRTINAAGLSFVSLDDGFATLFDLYFQLDFAHAAVIPCPDWQAYADRRHSRNLKTQPLCPARAEITRRALAASEDLLHRVRCALSDVVGDAIEVYDAPLDTPLATLGVSSLHAVSFADALSNDIKLDLPPTLVFECVSLQGVADYVAGKLNDKPSMISVNKEIPSAAQKGTGLFIRGAACALPGGIDDVADLWNRLCASANCVVLSPPAGRPPQAARPAGYLDADAITGLDRGAFGISKAEACVLDPQQRLSLRCGSEALQFLLLDDDQDVNTLVGVTQVDFAQLVPASRSAYAATGAATVAAVANRIAYVFNLKGLSAAVDTACSSTLVALYLARRCGNASLVGGVNVVLTERWSAAFALAGMLSPTHRCAYGDDAADGYVRGEAASFIAIAPNSTGAPLNLRAVAVNQDGHSNGLTAPNPAAQAAMLRKARDDASERPCYVEAHGTGTRLGDPIELEALSRVYGDITSPVDTASVKSNLGHSECAAAGTSLIKLFALARNSPQLPISLHVRKLNTVVDWASLGVRIVTTPCFFLDGAKSRRVLGCSGFGFAGTNAHAIFLESGRIRCDRQDEGTAQAASGSFILESHSPKALAATARRWMRHWDRQFSSSVLNNDEFCASLTAANAAHRRMVLRHSPHTVRACFWDLASLANIAAGESFVADEASLPTKDAVCFVFSGQGTAYVGMGADAAWNDIRLEAAIRAAASIGDSVIGLDYPAVTEALFGGPTQRRIANAPASSAILQTAQVCLQYAVYEETASRALPNRARHSQHVFVGHSLGEVAALACAGTITLQSALEFAAGRGAAFDALENKTGVRSGLMAVASSRESVEPLLPSGCAIAVVNSPMATVVAAVDETTLREAELALSGLFAVKRLDVDAAFHSSAIDSALPDIWTAATKIRAKKKDSSKKVAVVSTLDGELVVAQDVVDNPNRWVAHAREICNFEGAICTALVKCDLFVEIGPRPQLARHIDVIAKSDGVAVSVIPTVRFKHAVGFSVVDFENVRAAFEVLYPRKSPAKRENESRDFNWPPHSTASSGMAWISEDEQQLSETFTSAAQVEDASCKQRLVYSVDWETVKVLALSPTIRKRNTLVISDDENGNIALHVANAMCNYLQAASVSGSALDCVFFGAGLTQTSAPEDIERTLYNFVGLLRRFGDRQDLAIVILTRNVFASALTTQPNLAGTALWGACETARLELRRGPRLVCVDVDAPGPLMLEAPLSLSSETSLRICGGVVSAQRVRGFGEHVHGASHRWFASPTRGTVLVTGGTGALGMAVARWLNQQSGNRMQLVLLSRSGRIAEDELLEPNMEVVRCDVGIEIELRAACSKYRGTIVGAIHAAGVLSDATLGNITQEQITKIFEPKVRGAINLTRLIEDEPIEFCWFFSSVTALMGNPGQMAYGAANAVLDGICRRGGPKYLSIQWGPWADRGMAAPLRDRLQASVWTPLIDDDALAGLGTLLCSPNRPLVASVTRFNGSKLRESCSKFEHRKSLFRHVVTAEAHVSKPINQNGVAIAHQSSIANEPAIHVDPADMSAIEEAIMEAIEQFLPAFTADKDGNWPRDVNKSLASLGMDSLDGAEISAYLSNRFHCVVPPTFFLEAETIADLRELVKRELCPEAAKISDGENAASADSLTNTMQCHNEKESTLQRLLEAHGANTRNLTRDTLLTSLGLDSLDSASVAADLASHFNEIFSPMLLLELNTFGDLCDACGGVTATLAQVKTNGMSSGSLSKQEAPQTARTAHAADGRFASEALTVIESLRLPCAASLIAWGFVKLCWWALRVVVIVAATSSVVSIQADALSGVTFRIILRCWVSGMLIFAVANTVSLSFALCAKWLLVGRYREVRSESLWSWYALRCDLAHRAILSAEAAMSWMLADGSPWIVVWYRLLGAKLGSGVSLVVGACKDAPDLCAIGCNVVFERNATMAPTQFDPGVKRFGARKCVVGPRARVSTDAVIRGGCVIGAGAHVKPSSTAMGLVAPGAMVNGMRVEETSEDSSDFVYQSYFAPTGQTLSSNNDLPSSNNGHRNDSSASANGYPVRRGRQFVVACICDAGEILFLFGLGVVPAFVVGALLYIQTSNIILSHAVLGFYLCLFALTAKKLLLGFYTWPQNTAIAEEPATEWKARRLAFVDRAAGIASFIFVDALFRSTIFQNVWLKMLGAKVDWTADISCLRDFRASTAHFLEIGRNAFLAGNPRFSCSELRETGKVLRHSRVRIGDLAFVGFGSTLLPGTCVKSGGAVADFALVGSRRTVEAHTTILGQAGFSERVIAFKRFNGGCTVPGRSWRSRGLPLLAYHGALLSCLAAAIVFEYIGVISTVKVIRYFISREAPVMPLVFVVLSGSRICFGGIATVIALLHKHLVLGRLWPHEKKGKDHPAAWEVRSFGIASWLVQFRLNLAVDAWLEPFAYTPVISAIWRAFGARVGCASRVGRVGPPDHDALSIGDRVYIDATSPMYAHDFAGGALSFKPCVLGDDVSLLGPSAILPGTSISSRIAIGSGSMTLAGTYSRQAQQCEVEEMFTLYRGNPARICVGRTSAPDDCRGEELATESLWKEGRADADWRYRNDGVRVTSLRLVNEVFELVRLSDIVARVETVQSSCCSSLESSQPNQVQVSRIWGKFWPHFGFFGHVKRRRLQQTHQTGPSAHSIMLPTPPTQTISPTGESTSTSSRTRRRRNRSSADPASADRAECRSHIPASPASGTVLARSTTIVSSHKTARRPKKKEVQSTGRRSTEEGINGGLVVRNIWAALMHPSYDATNASAIVACAIITYAATSRYDWAFVALVLAASTPVLPRVQQTSKSKRLIRKKQKQFKTAQRKQQGSTKGLAIGIESEPQRTAPTSATSFPDARTSRAVLAVSQSTNMESQSQSIEQSVDATADLRSTSEVALARATDRGFDGVVMALVMGSNNVEFDRDLDQWRALCLSGYGVESEGDESKQMYAANIIRSRLEDLALLSQSEESTGDKRRVAAIVGRSGAQLYRRIEALGEAIDAKQDVATAEGVIGPRDLMSSDMRNAPVVLMFGGESLYDGAARALWLRCSEFKAEATRIGNVLASSGVFDNDTAGNTSFECSKDMVGLFLGEQGATLDQLSIRQRNALVFVIQYALASVIRHTWCLEPAAVLGYSIGELAASVIAGALDLHNVADLLSATRYTHFDERQGNMAVCSGIGRAGLDEICREIGDVNLIVAAEYSPDTFMIAGPTHAVQAAAISLRSRRATCTILKDVHHAYHSPLHSVSTGVVDVRPKKPRIPFYSCAAGGLVVGSTRDRAVYDVNDDNGCSREHVCSNGVPAEDGAEWPKTLTDLGALYAAPVLFHPTMNAVVSDTRPMLLLDLSLKGDLAYYYSAWRTKHSGDHPPRAIATLRPEADSCERCVLAAADLCLSGIKLAPAALGARRVS